jgi:hypothetical protein
MPSIHFLTDRHNERLKIKNDGVGGAAVSGRLSLAGTEARSTELFSYKFAFKWWHRFSTCASAG